MTACEIPQYLAEKFLGTGIFGAGEKCLRRAMFNNHAIISVINVIGNFPRKSHFMRKTYACNAILCQILSVDIAGVTFNGRVKCGPTYDPKGRRMRNAV